MKILILCTGNSARSQMAEEILRKLDSRLEIYSAGTKPADRVNPFTIKALDELGINISGKKPQPVENFLKDSFDYVITVCDGAKETCPYFSGVVKHRMHIGFEDPAEFTGSDQEKLDKFRDIREQISGAFGKFYQEHLKNAQL